MSEHATTPDTEESRTALKSVDQARRALVEATRGPVWLTALGTGMLAVVLLGGWLLDESGPKEAVTGLGTLAFFGLWGFYLSLLNRKGLKIRVIPPSSAGRWFMLGHVAFFILLFVLTGWLRKRGHSWAPWASTAIICATFAIQSHRFPTGEPIGRADRQ